MSPARKTPADLEARLSAAEREIAELKATFARVYRAFVGDDDAKPDIYSTGKNGPRPEGYSEKSWRQIAPTVPGSYKPPPRSTAPIKPQKDGRIRPRESRVWLTPRAAFEAWKAGDAPETRRAPAAAEWTPDAALAAADRRRSNGAVRR